MRITSDPSILRQAAKDRAETDPEPAHDLALVISDLSSGGSQRVLMQLVDSWSASGRRLAVITLANPETDFFHLQPGIKRVTLSGIELSRNRVRGLLANLDRIRRLRAALRRVRAPIAIAFIMPMAVLTLLASRGLKIRVIACERNDPERQNFGRVWRLLRRLTYGWADVVTANSHGALGYLSRFVPRGKLLYVTNPVSAAPEGERVALSHPTVLAIGRLHQQKAHDVLLKAFSTFAARHRDWRLAIIGVGPAESDLRTLADDLKITDRVVWLGAQKDPYKWLRAARLFALPSRYEGTPNALLEAMSCGLPCIVSDASPGPLDLIEDGVTGLVTPVEDVEALARALERVAADPAWSRQLGKAAQRRVQASEPQAALLTWEAAIELAKRGHRN